ncbi:glycosyl hydrolase family 43 protein [Rutstroemia sp. NJR-2017a BVV2]|nr:glycosyl hydrolase family 43 protein [Rutstroemia sp. NJR-2017a BVV2]
MNVFRRKKEAKEPTESAGRGSSDIESSTPTAKSSKPFRLGRKNIEPEPKVELDLENALPSSDDFRTSLLMNGLSARFSMLREQDDPNSKIGKASDDSVLFPKRQSRMNDFNFQAHNLSDIAEVSSMHGSVRPPFSFSKTDLSADGYGTDDDSIYTGSIMSRPKPGESNVLFGGRQKIYKLSTKSSGKGSGEGGGMGGRALYDNDVSQSAFQKLREKERQEWQEHNDDDDDNANTSAEISRPGSPSLAGYNRNRETSSTTSSGPTNARMSTAATSVTSQRTPSLSGSHTPISAGGSASERSATKTRRLYETGLDQHLHEQQHSTMNRIDTLTRQRNMGAQTPPLGMHSPTSATSSNAFDRWDRQPILAKGSMPNLRAASPPPNTSALSGFDFGVKSNNLTVETKFGYSVPPLSPPVSENDDNSAQPVQTSEKSKNEVPGVDGARSSQAQDENRQPERDVQVPHGRETPTFRKHPPPGVFVPRQQPGLRTRTDSSATADSSQTQSPVRRHFPPRDRLPDVPSSKQRIGLPESPRAGPGSFQRLPNSNFPRSPSSPEHATKPPTGGRPWGLPQPRSFPNLKYRNGPSSGQQSPETQRSETPQQAPEPESPQQRSPSPSSPTVLEIKTTPPADDDVAAEPPADSPTLPGLSGMVRQHLRSDSNGSSIYNIPYYEPHIPSDPVEPSSPIVFNTNGNPWDINDWDQDTQDDTKTSFESTTSSLTKVNSALPAPLAVKPNVPESLPEENVKAAWEIEMEKHHARSGSSATQKEQEDFKNELASRRRQVQENLKHLNEPGSSKSDQESSRSNPLGLLKAKTSFGSLGMKQKEAVGQSKAMRMIGMGSQPTHNGPMPVKNGIDENSWKKEEEEMLRNVPGGSTPPQMKAFRQARRDAQRDRERELAMRHKKMGGEFNDVNWSNQRRGDPRQGQDPRQVHDPRLQGPAIHGHPPNMGLRQRAPSRERKPPPMSHAPRNPNRESKGSIATSNSGSRPPSRTSPDRSGSDASGRSKSRNGRYRDDLAKAMAEGTGTSSQSVIEDLQSARLKLKPTATGLSTGSSPGVSPGLSPGIGQASPLPSPSMGGRPRSNSKANNAGYFDPQRMQALQTGDALDLGISPRPSPVTPFSVNSTPSLVAHSPVDSRSTTPTTQGFQPNNRAMMAGRKKSVTKSEISEPTFISSTSRVSTIDLPPGSSLQNGIDAPPIPPVNPRRRQTRAMFGALIGKKDEYEEMHSLPDATQSTEEMSTFSADEESKPKSRQRLRKSSSEGGNLNAKARHAAFNAPSPAMPSFPAGVGYSSTPGEGGMF